MKSKMRIFAIILAAAIILALAAPLAMAEDGAAFSVGKGQTKRFEIYRRSKVYRGGADTSVLYRDFTSVTTGDENIAQIVDQHGIFQVVGKSIGITTYEATTTEGETFTGTIAVIFGILGFGDDVWLGGSRGGWVSAGQGYDYRVEYFIADPIEMNSYLYTPKSTHHPESYTEVVTEKKISDTYGRFTLRYKNWSDHDVTISVSGNIRMDDNGYFFKEGEPEATRPGYANKLWGGTITMTSPTKGTSTVNVYLE